MENAFWSHEDLPVGENIQKFADLEKSSQIYEKHVKSFCPIIALSFNPRFYLDSLINCISESSTATDDEWFDRRYFCRDHKTEICHCTCGVVRDASAVVLRREP